MAVVVTEASCRAVLLFALKREAGPLVFRQGLQAGWLEDRQTFAFVRKPPDEVDFIEPTPDDVIFDFSGVGRAAAGAKLERLLTHFPRPGVVIAAGFCGALRGRHEVGDVAVPAAVCDESGRRWACHPLPGLRPAGRLLTAARIVGDVVEKCHTGRRFDADFVDMESAGVAEACEARGLPFAAVRAVSDTADTALSPRLADLLSGGRVSPLRAAWAVVRQPSLLGEFRRLARDTRLAAENLADALSGLLRPPGPR